jgi:hypothetical protein
MSLRLPASHTRNRCAIIRLTAGAMLTTLLQKPPFLRRLHHHRARMGPCLAAPAKASLLPSSRPLIVRETLRASSWAEAPGPP